MTKPKTPTRKAGKDERALLTAALLDELVLPGIKQACKILRNEMKDADTSGNAARMIIKVAQELVQKGFPEVTAEDKAAMIRKELEDIEDNTPEEGGGGEEGSDSGAAPTRLGVNGSQSGLLPGEEDL